MKKINGKVILIIVWLLVIGLLIYSRFINLGWGLPYPMHPDERNMAVAVTEISLRQLYSPSFWSYGGLQINLAHFLLIVQRLLSGTKQILSLEQVIISLRSISAAASIITAFFIFKIINSFKKINPLLSFLTFLLIIFSPGFIQFSHFGTTESLLILTYTVITYYLIIILKNKKINLKDLLKISFVLGMAVATKISAALFSIIIGLVFIKTLFIKEVSPRKILNFILIVVIFAAFLLFFTFIFSPHYFLFTKNFLDSLYYEKSLVIGQITVFYTRQFIDTKPFVFELEKIFPYALGWPVFILGMLGFLGLSWKNKHYNLLRLAIIIYFIPNAFLFTKWTRFMAPIFPLVLVFAILFLLEIKIKFIKIIIVLIAILPGIAYLSVYQNPDVRFQASEWIYKNIPEKSYILSETANVVDIPIIDQKEFEKNYQIISFNFYDLDESPEPQSELKDHLEKADYIFVPSRRIFANHPKGKYPLLNNYYDKLFYGKLGFKEIAEFDSYPKICLLFTGKCLTFPDEQAEETWTVFDHPVIRIYKKIKSF